MQLKNKTKQNKTSQNHATCVQSITIEVLNLNPPLKKAIILLLHQTFVKVLKDALGHLAPYQTLTKVWCNDSGDRNIVPLPATIQI